MLCCVVLCCVALRCVALCCVALCCVVLCCVVLCCVVLLDGNIPLRTKQLPRTLCEQNYDISLLKQVVRILTTVI